jgi:hypothetical protein
MRGTSGPQPAELHIMHRRGMHRRDMRRCGHTRASRATRHASMRAHQSISRDADIDAAAEIR